MTTDAGKEVARSKKVMDNTGKEFTLFLAPKPIKGKPLDKTKMFSGQLPYLFKQEESSAKCRKHTSTAKKGDAGPSPNGNQFSVLEDWVPRQLVQSVLADQRTRTEAVTRVEWREPRLPIQHLQAVPEERLQVDAATQTAVSSTFIAGNIINFLDKGLKLQIMLQL